MIVCSRKIRDSVAMDKWEFPAFYSRYCSACIEAAVTPLALEVVAILVAELGLRELLAPLDVEGAWKPCRCQVH
jgi:hypothetical protein